MRIHKISYNQHKTNFPLFYPIIINASYNKSEQMGSSQNKDPNVIIYVSLARKIHIAGEMVYGTVHIDCKFYRPYKQLYIRLTGSESVDWSEGGGKHRKYYSGTLQTYKQQFVLAVFPNQLQPGQYDFPFSILLPSALPASLCLNEKNYIQYVISAYLPPWDDKSSIQAFERELHVREFCRLPSKVNSISGKSEAVCWGCCCMSSQVDLSLEANVSLHLNEHFQIKGIIDNTNGTSDIKSYKIAIKQRTKKFTLNKFSNGIIEEFIITQFDKQIPVGTTFPFQTQVSIPSTLTAHSAIGNSIYRAHFLQLSVNISCNYSYAKTGFLVILNNNIEPPFQTDKQFNLPQERRARVSQPISFVNLRPYIYNPIPGFDVFNRGVQNNSSMMRPIFNDPQAQYLDYNQMHQRQLGQNGTYYGMKYSNLKR